MSGRRSFPANIDECMNYSSEQWYCGHIEPDNMLRVFTSSMQRIRTRAKTLLVREGAALAFAFTLTLQQLVLRIERIKPDVLQHRRQCRYRWCRSNNR
ncbi:hypothetical protein PENSPDRAFT_653072 [Peniophora sp. CONT]|nr:hypothetical protein PENSPDRAFT_653072 [Peniophora sp. CONT]